MMILPWHLWIKVIYALNFNSWKPLGIVTYGRAQAYWAYVRSIFLYTVALGTFGAQSWLVVSTINVDTFVNMICIFCYIILPLVGILTLHLCRSLSLHLTGIKHPATGLLHAFQSMSDLFSFHASHLLFWFTQMCFNHHIVYLTFIFLVMHSLTNSRWLKLCKAW